MFDVGVTDLDNVNRRVQRYLKYSVALVVLAIASPVLSLTGWLMPAADLPHVWFQRSGAVTTIFSLFAGAGTASVLGGLIPRGMTDLKLEAARSIFEIKFRTIERIAFWLTIVGTVIWGYGDLIYIWLK